MVDAKLCAQHLLLKRMIQIDVGAICYLRVSTMQTWVRIANIGEETVDCVSVQFFASKRPTLCIHYWYAINQSTKMSQSKLMLFFSSATEKRKRDSNDSDESQPGPSTPKKTSRPRGFCDDWLVKYDWLYLENGKMKCHPCINTYTSTLILPRASASRAELPIFSRFGLHIVQFYILFSVNRLNSNKTKWESTSLTSDIYNDATSISCKRSVCDPLKLKMTPKVNYLGVTMTPENFFEGKTLYYH